MWFADPTDNLVGRVTTATGAISTFAVPGAPTALITGPDGNLWVAQSGSGQVAIVSPAGTVVQEITVPGDGTANGPTRLAVRPGVGPAATVWFVDGDRVGSIVNVAPLTATLGVTLTGASLGDITKDPNGLMWVTELNTGKLVDLVGLLPPEHTVQPAPLGPSFARITVVPDGNLWFTDPSASSVGEVNLGSGDTITLYPIPTAASSPSAIAAGSDGNIWFTETGTGAIARLSPSDPTAIIEFGQQPGSQRLDDIAPDALGNLWAGDSSTGVITLVEPPGRYVELVYHDLLGRAPDSAGLAFWDNALETDASPSDVATSFTGSYEYRAINVTADYNLLGRGPDAAGLAYWVGYIGSGATYEDLEASLIASDEYHNVRGGGTVDGFVTAVYHDILKRAPDAAGLQSGPARSAVAFRAM